ncbi:transposase [Asanoa sp. NPDC049518]|uniref:transposase n=1 Tax=unclassified Asanoa TaxID=2685164 RepID=UPI003431A9BE
MEVTRIAYSARLNPGKFEALREQARRLGRVRSLAWQLFGSINAAPCTGQDLRNLWMRDGTCQTFGVAANAWKETLRDALDDIVASRESAKAAVRRRVARRPVVDQERCYRLLKANRWTEDRWLSRQMRQQWKRGKNHTHNQIIIRADKVSTFVLAEGGDVWLKVPGLEPRRPVAVPLNTKIAPQGTLRLILRHGRVEVHHQVDADTMHTSHRPCGTRMVGVDKGYTEVLTDSDGDHHGERLGMLLTSESDRITERNRRRAKLRSIANTASEAGRCAKAARVRANNLGTMKRDRQAARHQAQVRTEIFTAVHRVVDKAAIVVAEDLTKKFSGRRPFGKKMKRRLAAWTKGVTAEALTNVSERRGSALVLVNAAYTSRVCPRCGGLGSRAGEQLYCTSCGVMWQADHAAAINVLRRHGDPDITLRTPYQRVKEILRERADRQRIRLPIQDSSRAGDGGERSIRLRPHLDRCPQ